MPIDTLINAPLLAAASLVFAASDASAEPTPQVGVMSFNVWTAEDSGSGRDGIVAAVQAGHVDVVGFQEMNGNRGPGIAEQLGMSYDSGSMIASRFRILDTSYAKGVKLELAPGHEAYVFNVHLRHYYYGPYQLAGIPYHGGALYDPAAPGSVDAVVQDQIDSRGAEIDAVLAELADALASGLPVFLTGDFNEPSHLDWSAEAVAGGRYPVEVPWPTSIKVAEAGLSDAYRAVHGDEVQVPGHTWSPVYGPDYINNGVNETQDRIDLVYFAGSGVEAIDARTIGPNDGISQVGVAGFPSDHRAVATRFGLEDLRTTTLNFTALAPDGEAIDPGYGHRVLSTPQLAIAYLTEGGQWKTWSGRNWGRGVGFLDSGDGGQADGATFTIRLTADDGVAAWIDRFTLTDWQESDTQGQEVAWSLRRLDGSEIVSGLAEVGDNQSLVIEPGLAGAVPGGLVLHLEHVGGIDNHLGIDNVVFDQWLIGDLSRDGRVDEADLARLLASWGGETAAYDWSSGELTGDGRVDGEDLQLLLRYWTEGEAPQVTVPEASTGFLLLPAVLTCVAASRR